jgi:hypothetical protein
VLEDATDVFEFKMVRTGDIIDTLDR